MKKPEKDVEKYLRSRLRNLGGQCYKWRAIDNKGVPDRVCVLPWVGTFFVELKRLGGKPTKLQEKVFNDIKDSGGVVFVVQGMEGVDALIDYVDQFRLENL